MVTTSSLDVREIINVDTVPAYIERPDSPGGRTVSLHSAPAAMQSIRLEKPEPETTILDSTLVDLLEMVMAGVREHPARATSAANRMR